MIINNNQNQTIFFAILVDVLQFEMHLTKIGRTFKLPLFVLTTFFKIDCKEVLLDKVEKDFSNKEIKTTNNFWREK